MRNTIVRTLRRSNENYFETYCNKKMIQKDHEDKFIGNK